MEKDMDFHGLKRKELQSLCKKHGIPANLKNVEMADRLSALLKEEKPTKRGRSCLKNLSVIDEGDEELADSKEPKRVKFSPQNETFVFEKTDPRELRLLARKRRVFQKPEIELGNVDDVEKPVGRNLRRRSVVGKSDADLEPEVVEKPVGRILRRRSVVVKPDSVLDAGVVDYNLEKPVGRVSRRKSVVVKPDVVVDTETVDDNVGKPVGRILRRKSVVVKPDVVLDTETVDDNVGKPVARVLRRKSVVVKPDVVLDTGTVADNVENLVGRVSRRKSVMVKPDVVLDTRTVDDNVGKPVERISRRKSVAVKPAAVVDDGNNLVERGQTRRSVRQVQKVETKGRKTAFNEQKNAEVLDQAVAENVQQKSPEMVADVKKGKRVRKPAATLKPKGVVEDTINENVENDKNSEIRGLKRKGLGRKNDNVDKDVGSKEIKVVRRSSSQAGMSKVDASASCLMVEDEKVNEMEAQYTNESEATGCSAPATDGTEYVQHKETLPGNLAPVQSLSENREHNREHKIDELRHATGNTASAEKKVENSEETTGFSPNRSEKLYVKTNLMQLKDCPEDADIIDKVHENEIANNESSMLQNSGKGGVESPKLEDCPEETYIIDKPLENAVAADQIPANDESSMLQNCGEGGVESLKIEDFPEETYIIDKALENAVAADQTPANDESPMLQNSSEDGGESSKLDDCPEETNIIDKALENAVAADQTPANNENSILQDSGGGGIKSAMQADKLEENSLNMISVLDKISYEEIASITLSNLKRQLSGEPDCHSAVEPSLPRGSGGSDTDGKQLSSPFGELEAGRDNKILESSDGLKCFNQSRNEHFIEQGNKCEESPSEIENAEEDGMVDRVALITKEQENECEHSESASENDYEVEDEVVDHAVMILKEQENECEESPSENEIAVEDEVVDNAAVILKEQEPELEESPSQNENAVDEVVYCVSVVLKESDVQPTEQEEAASLWSSCDTISTKVELTMPEICFDQQQSSHLISEEKVVLGPEADLEANAQSPNVVEGLTLSSIASAAAFNKTVEEDKAAKTVTPLRNRGIDCSSSDAENSHLDQSLKKDDSEARTNSSPTMNISSLYLLSQVDGGVRVFSSSIKKGEESCNETSRSIIGCLENSIQANNLAKEDKAVMVEQVDEMNSGLEAVTDDYMTNPNDSKELKSEKAVSATKQVIIVSYDGEETPVSIHERKWFQVAHEGNLCSDAFGSISNNASECISVSDKTKCLKQSSVDAAEGRDTGDEEIKNSSVNPLNVEDREREMSETSCTRNVISCFDVGSVCTEVSEQCEHNPEVDTIAVVDEHEFHLKHDDISAVLNSTPQKEILFRLEKLCDNYFFPLSDLAGPSGSKAEETPSRDLTCFTNDRNVDVDEYDKYSSAKQEGASFSTEPKLQHLFSGHDSDTFTKYTFSKDQESGCAAWNTEDLLALGEVEELVSDPTKDLELIAVGDAEDKYDVDVTLLGENNGAVENSVSDPAKDLELMVAKDAENTDDDVNLHGANGEPAETSNNEIATFSGDLKSISNEISENSPVKEMADPVSALHVRDNESSADLKSNHFSSPAKPIKIQTPEVLLAQNSSHFATQEKTNLKLNVDKFTAQTSNSLGPEEVTMAQETGCTKDAEGLSICGNETPGSTIHEKLDEALEQEFCQQTVSVGSIKKNFDYFSQEAGAFEGASGECEIISEKEILKSNNETGFVEAVERGIAMQNSLDMSETGKSDAVEEKVEVCSMVAFNQVHNVGNEEDAGSCSGYLEMSEKFGSTKRKSETFSLRDTASVLDNDAGSITVSCTPLNKESTCHFADAYAAASETALDSLQSSQIKCNNSLQNACVNDIEELHLGELMLFKDDQDNTVNSSDKAEPDAEDSDVLSSKLATPTNMSSLVSTTEMHDGPESTAGKDLVEYASTTERELQGNCLFGQEIINQEHVDMDPTHKEPKEACMNEMDHVVLEVSGNSASSPCGIYVTNSDQEHNVHRENISPAYNDAAPELDSAKFSEVRDALDDRGCSEDREANISSLTPPLINTTNSASLIARHEVLESTSNQRFVNIYNVHEMAQEVLSTFTLLNQENDEGYGRGNSEPNSEETEGMKSRNGSFVFTDTEIDMFWDEIEKEEASKLQTEVSDVTFSVNEYEAANVENYQPAVGADSDPGEQKLQEVNEREERGDSADQVGDEQNCINVQENESSMIRRKNTRSILIHGTPKKPPPFVHDMKENAAAPKRLQMVGATAVKPRRKVLGDVSK